MRRNPAVLLTCVKKIAEIENVMSLDVWGRPRKSVLPAASNTTIINALPTPLFYIFDGFPHY